jgi:hypothetical protein
LIIQTRKPESLFQTHVMLNNIQNFETQNDWVSSYLLAHTLSMERAGQFICIQEPMSYTYAIMSNLPFSSWLPVLQDPQKANCLIHRFQESLPSFNLNFEGKATCASSVFNWYHAERENQYTQRHCLAILVDLSKEPEGKAAVLAAGGLKFLITVLKDVFERKKYSADIQILQHTIELIHAIAPLPPLSGSETMVIVVKVLHSIITTWAIFQSQNTTEPKVQDLETMTVQALQMLDTFPEASYAPSSEGECSSVPPTISEKTPRPPTTSLEAPQKPSESCDACCRIA